MIKTLPEILERKLDVLWVLKGFIATMIERGWETVGIIELSWMDAVGTWIQKDGVTIYVAYKLRRYRRSGVNTHWVLDRDEYAGAWINTPEARR